MPNRYVGQLGTDTYGISLDQVYIGYLKLSTAQAAVLDADGILDGQESAADAVTTVTTFLAQPPYPRNITILPGGTTDDVKAASITVTGTNIRDEVITEAFAFLANATDPTVGAKAFKTVTSVSIPAQDGAGATFDVGWGDKLGLPVMLTKNPLAEATLNGVWETTKPTVVADNDEIEKNTIDLHSALNGTAVEIYLHL